MADESRWSEDDRFGRNDERWWRTDSGPRGERDEALRYGRDYGQPYRGYSREREESWRGQGRDQGAPSGYYGRERGDTWRGYDREPGQGYRDYRRDAGYGGPRGEERYGREENRGWFERAADEVSSWFGDDDAQRRRERDAMSMGHRGRGPKGYVRSDDRIREDVCDRLSDDSLVDASDIEVSVMGSEVTLSGTVQTREERRRAEDCAERVLGVSHVQNNLRMSQAGSVSGTSSSRLGGNAMPNGTGSGTGRAPH